MGLKTTLVCLALGALVGLQAATQLAANRFGRAEALGSGFPINPNNSLYPPWAWLQWSSHWGKDPSAGPILRQGLAFPFFGLALGGMVGQFLGQAGAPRHRGWANAADAHKAGLRSDDGCVLGQLGKGTDAPLLTTADLRPSLVTGATRSGKGRGHVVPTLLLWRHAAIVHDPKGELFSLTSGWRAPWSPVLVFNPRAPWSARFNPLAEIRPGAQALADVQRLVSVLADPSGRRDEDSIWDTAASAILEAVILHVVMTAEDDAKTLVTVRTALADLDATAKAMVATCHSLNAQGHPACHPMIAEVAGSYLAKHEKYRSSVEATAQSYLKWLSGDHLERALGASDFRVGDLVCLDAPLTLYVQVAPADQKALRPLLRLLFSATMGGLTTAPDHDAWGRRKVHPLLMVMDEFPLLGRLDFFEKTLRLMSGYGIKPMLVAQSLNDIMETYGVHNTLLDNTHVFTAFSALDPLTQDRVSKLTGTTTTQRVSRSMRGGLLGPTAHSVADQDRPLLEPGEVRGLPDHEQIVFVAGYRPWRCTKVAYDQREPFRSRAKIAPPRPETLIAGPGLPHPWAGSRALQPISPPDDRDAENPSASTAQNGPHHNSHDGPAKSPEWRRAFTADQAGAAGTSMSTPARPSVRRGPRPADPAPRQGDLFALSTLARATRPPATHLNAPTTLRRGEPDSARVAERFSSEAPEMDDLTTSTSDATGTGPTRTGPTSNATMPAPENPDPSPVRARLEERALLAALRGDEETHHARPFG